MKTIGIIGGMSWQSSMEYYKILNEYAAKIMDESHSCKVILYSVEFSEIAKFTHQENWPAIGEIVKKATINLEKAGADIIVLATNLIHIVSNYIESNTNVPFLHIAEATGVEIKAKKLNKVGLIGTKFTMEKEFYTKYISDRFGVEVIVPNEEDRQVLHDIIYSELIKGIFTESSKNKCKRIIEKLQLKGIEGIILGCTEFPLLIPENEINIPSFDTTKIHALAALNLAIT